MTNWQSIERIIVAFIGNALKQIDASTELSFVDMWRMENDSNNDKRKTAIVIVYENTC